MKRIKFTDGCLNNCSYCYEQTDIKTYNPAIPDDKEIQILDMNFLCNPKAKEILRSLPKKKYEFICGIDYRRLDQEICDLMKEKGFIKVRWAWDYEYNDKLQKTHQKVWKMLKKAGYKSEELSVFILVNWKITYFDCLRKLDLLKIWNVKVNDCCFDGGYPKSKAEFITNPRFKDKYWTYDQLKSFRKKCRKHNQMVRFKIDPELKNEI